MDSFRHSLPYAKDNKLVCPNCSKYIGHPDSWLDEVKITEAIFLVVRVNKQTGEKFLGCPNFPKCKHSEEIYSKRVVRNRIRNFNIDYEDELRPY